MEIPFVGKIENLYKFDKDAFEGIWGCQQIAVTEKLHGTGALIAIFSDRVEVGGRRRMYEPGQGIKDQYEITMAIGEQVRKQMLAEDGVPSDRVIIYGEFVGPRIQKGIKYGDTRGFWAFQVLIGESMRLDVVESEKFCETYDIKFVPVLYVGKPDYGIFENLHAGNSRVLGIEDNIMEGIVITSVPVMFDRWGKLIRAKHKNDKWAEKASAPKEGPDTSAFVLFAKEYVNQIRVLHTVERLRTEGIWERAMSDMKYLPNLIMEDLKEEVGLGDLDERQTRKAVTKQVARLYRAMLEARELL